MAELLGLAAGECYREGHFLWAARAYHSLEYLQQQGLPVAWAVQPPGVAAAGGGGVWEGKRAAVVQAFRQLAEGRGKASALLPELLGMLRSSTNPQAAAVAGTMKQWAREHAPEAAAALA